MLNDNPIADQAFTDLLSTDGMAQIGPVPPLRLLG